MNTFIMLVDNHYTPKIQANHITLQGFVQRGSINIGDMVDIKHLSGQSKQAKVINSDTENDIATMILKTDDISFAENGFFITSVGMSSYSKFVAKLKLLTPEEGGRSNPLQFTTRDNYEVILYVHNQTFLITPYPIQFENMAEIEFLPGNTHDWFIDTYERYIPLEVGDIIELREGIQPIARGAIIKLITDD